VGYAYPWDFPGDPAAVDRARTLGLDAVAVAAAYHTVRAASPLHPGRRTTDASYAACYVPVRKEAWRGRRLRPAPPTWVDSPDSFGVARDALRATGLQAHAWTVLTHNSRLGREHPDLTVRNAFGEGYLYALCPSAEEVAEYCGLLAQEVVLTGQPDGLVLEACGPLGIVHGGHHDKTDLAGWTKVEQRLLSLCFCTACRRRYADAGLDPARISALVRQALVPGKKADSVQEALGAEEALTLAGTRAAMIRDLRAHVIKEARAADPGLHLTLHATADPWAVGPFATVAAGTGARVDALVGSCWDPGPAGAVGLRELRAVAGPGTAIGGYLLATDGQWTGTVPGRMDDYLAAGMDELHLYHLGLVGEPGLRLMARILAAASVMPAA
jgi:hypothetical protein